MGEITKAKINLKDGSIELEGSENFVSSYLNEFKELLSKPSRATIHTETPTPEPPTPKKPAGKKNSTSKSGGKKSAPKVSTERFDIHGSNDTPSLESLMAEKKPGTGNGNIIAVIGYYITEILGNAHFSEGQIEYAYKMLKLKRPGHLHQIMINNKNERDLFEPNADDGSLWHLTRTGEIYVSDQLPES